MFIERDKMDDWIFRDVRKNNEAIPRLEDDGKPKLAKWPEVVRDIWSGLYKSAPKLEEGAEGPLANALQEVMETQEWKNLRNHTKLDELGSAIGTSSFGRNFLESLPEEVMDAEQAHQQEQRLKESLESIRRDMPGRLPALERQLEKQVKQAGEDAKAAQAKAEKATEGDIAQAVRIAARDAASKAETETAETVAFAKAWGNGAGAGASLPLSEQLRIANKLKSDTSMRLLAKLIGRMKRLAAAMQAEKINRMPDEIVDVETGDNLPSVLCSELMKLRNPVMKRAFYRDFANKDLLQYRREGREQAGRGPIVVMTDESGSMGGQRIEWAKAVGMGMAWIAQKQKRSVVLGGFSSGGQIWSKEYKSGNISAQEMEVYAKQFYGGGTDFEMALSRCAEIIQESKDFKRADVLFISDGDCYVSETFKTLFKAKKKQLGFRVMCVGVGVSGDSFKDFSDVAFGFQGDLSKDVPALERIFSV